MLKKKKCGLFLGLIVLAGSACVTPTHASSAPAIIFTHIQAGGDGNAREEAVALYNTTQLPVRLTNWCLINKSDAFVACFVDAKPVQGYSTEYILPPLSHAVVVSADYIAKHPTLTTAVYAPLIYEVTNTVSGTIVGSTESLKLVNDEDEIITEKSWTTTLSGGKILTRLKLIDGSMLLYATTNTSSDWKTETASLPAGALPTNALMALSLPVSQPPVTEGPEVPEVPGDPVEPEPPEESGDPVDSEPPESDEGVNQPQIPQEPQRLAPVITELLPNPSGVDTGNEFIELFNPSVTQALSLAGYRIKIGETSTKWLSLPSNITLAPSSYLALYNTSGAFTLPNGGGSVQLFYENEPAGSVIKYGVAKDDASWSLIGTQWQFIKPATPHAANETPVHPATAAAATATVTTQKSCASHQYRNPETGRCKALASAATGTLTPCKAGQERNLETNRCRNIAAAATTPSPCKEGQERNTETNRCRNIVKMSGASYGVQGVKDIKDDGPSWYYWGTVAVVVLAIISYAVWEWRGELLVIYRKARRLVMGRGW